MHLIASAPKTFAFEAHVCLQMAASLVAASSIWIPGLIEECIVAQCMACCIMSRARNQGACVVRPSLHLDSICDTHLLLCFTKFSKPCRCQHSKLCLVDLAGSERVDKSGTAGQTLDEGIQINRSLVSLGQCCEFFDRWQGNTCAIQRQQAHKSPSGKLFWAFVSLMAVLQAIFSQVSDPHKYLQGMFCITCL